MPFPATGFSRDRSAGGSDPLLALGCQDPVAQIREIKARDPQRQKVAELYELWWEHHGDAPTKASELRANPLRTTPLRRPFYLRFDLPDAAAAPPSSVMNSRRLIRSLVGAQQERFRDAQPNRFRSRQVNDQLELGRLLDRKVGWFRALEDLVDIGCGSEIEVREAYPVGHQASGLDELPSDIDGWQPVAYRRVRDHWAIGLEQTIECHEESVDALCDRGFKCTSDVVPATYIEQLCVDTKSAPRRLSVFPLRR